LPGFEPVPVFPLFEDSAQSGQSYTLYQEPDYLTFDELLVLSENPEPAGAPGGMQKALSQALKSGDLLCRTFREVSIGLDFC